MKIGAIVEDSLVDGEGLRLVIFLTGCSHNCPGCHNKKMQKYDYGVEYDNEYVLSKIADCSSWIKGITLSGGDPMFQMDAVKEFLIAFRKQFKHLDVWMYTGNKFEDIPRGLTKLIDVIVDGKYDQTLPKAKYRGSCNQRVMKKYLNTNKFLNTVYDGDFNNSIKKK